MARGRHLETENPSREAEGEEEKKGEEFQGKEHVLDGTLDRMEGASLRGPETLPPWNLVFKWSDTSWYHSLGPGSFSTLHNHDGT